MPCVTSSATRSTTRPKMQRCELPSRPKAEPGRFIVVDQGPGIAPSELPQIRDRFVRGSRAKGPGSGLGLSIVDLVSARFGAELQLANRAEGGLEATLNLPAGAIRMQP